MKVNIYQIYQWIIIQTIRVRANQSIFSGLYLQWPLGVQVLSNLAQP